MTKPKHNPENDRIKRAYRLWLKGPKGQSETTLDSVAAALDRFEHYTRFKSFKTFRPEQAMGFKTWLTDQKNPRTGSALSKATLYGTLKALRAFFQWLAQEPGYRSRLKFSDAAYFNLGANEVRIATAHREAPAPTLVQIRRVLEVMPTSTVVERRNRALVAFVILTGARDGATASFQVKHIDLTNGRLLQDAREVKTKNRKTFTSWFFPVGDDIRDIVAAWVSELIETHLWSLDDPLFPATLIDTDENGMFGSAGIKRVAWSNAQPIREVFRNAFAAAGLPYFNPHSFRKTLVRLGEERCRTPEEFKAWSQNLGHEQVLTTFTSYGAVATARQAEIIRGLGANAPVAVDPAVLLDMLVEAKLSERLREGAGFDTR